MFKFVAAAATAAKSLQSCPTPCIRKNNPNYFEFLLDKDNRDAVKHLRAEMNADDTAFRNWAIRFGMTPTERSKLPMMPEKPQSEMLQLIKRAKDKDAKAQ